MSQDLKTEADCRVIYADIINGYSALAPGNIFLKHNSELQNCLLEISRRHYFADSGSKGLLSEKDKLALLAEYGHWSVKEEEDYQQKISELESLRFSSKKLIIPQQQEHMAGEIKKKEKEMHSSFIERVQLLGMTKEYYANKKSQEEHILKSFYKDTKLSIPLFSTEESDNLQYREVSAYTQIYRDAHSVYFERNFKRIAVCYFFLNAFLMTEGNIYNFFGTPIINLTIYQLSLLGKGCYYKNLIQDLGIKSPPEEYYDDLDSVIKYFDQQYSIEIGKRSNNQLSKSTTPA